MKKDHEKSSGNVFADLGLPNSEQELLKAKLTVEIYRLIKALADRGKAVVVISSYLPEVINLSHRIIVFAGGRITAELEGPDIDESQVLEHFFTHERVSG